MYQDLKKHFGWPCIKGDIAQYNSKSLTCQKIKDEHQRLGGKLQLLEIL